MESKPVIPQPPARPAHPLQRKMWLAALIIVLSMAVGAVALFMGVRVILRSIAVSERSGSRQATVASPRKPSSGAPLWKSTQAGKPNPELPVYPGAEQVTPGTTSPVRLVFPGHETPGVLDAIYQTSDPVGKVQAFYRATLAEVYGFTEKDKKGRTTFDAGRGAHGEIIVLEPVNGGARIEFIHIPQGSARGD